MLSDKVPKVSHESACRNSWPTLGTNGKALICDLQSKSYKIQALPLMNCESCEAAEQFMNRLT